MDVPWLFAETAISPSKSTSSSSSLSRWWWCPCCYLRPGVCWVSSTQSFFFPNKRGVFLVVVFFPRKFAKKIKIKWKEEEEALPSGQKKGTSSLVTVIIIIIIIIIELYALFFFRTVTDEKKNARETRRNEHSHDSYLRNRRATIP